MNTTDERNAILISIRETWWDKIKTGEKKIELRKSGPKQRLPITCYVYVPELKAVCGQFFLWEVAPAQPSKELEQKSMVSIEQQETYKKDGTLYAWQIKMPAEYNYKFNLEKFLHVSRPPQAWQYITEPESQDWREARI